MPKNLRDILFGPEAYLPNPDVAALFRARYNEEYLKYQSDYVDETYRNQRPFDIRVAPLIGQSFTGRISQYNEQTSSIIYNILIKEIRSNLIERIQSRLYSDSGLRSILGKTSGASREITIKVEVMQYPRINVTLTGPFWLRFFYYGRRAFTIHGDPSNTRAHGKLVFYDPETLDKMVVSQVHMKKIEPGLYVERAVQDIKEKLQDPHFLDDFVGDVEERENLEKNLKRQLDRVRDEEGLQVTALLQELDSGQITQDRIRQLRRQWEAKERVALANLRNVVTSYEAKGLPERRQDKKEVYDALRLYMENVKTHLVTNSEIKTELPVNLAVRSTGRKIAASYR